MTGIDRYLTEEVVEKAAVAIQLSASTYGEIHLVYLPEYEELPDEDKRQRQHEACFALEAALPDIIRQAKAEAWAEGFRAGADKGIEIGERIMGIRSDYPQPTPNPYLKEASDE